MKSLSHLTAVVVVALTGAIALPFRATPLVRSSSFGSLRARLVPWLQACADHYATATAYEELSRLSDSQLKRRELSRDILARDL